MNFDMAMQMIRIALLTLGPVMATHGWASDEQWATITGAVISILTALWGVYVNWGSTKVPDSHAKLESVPTVSPLTGKVKTGPGL